MTYKTTVVVFGDSISFGQYIPHHLTWVSLVSRMLSVDTVQDEVLIQCEAVNGRTSRMALENMPMEVQKYQPDVVILQFGLNDCNHWESDKGLPRVSSSAFASNINEMIERAIHFGAKHVLVNTNHPTSRPFPPTSYSNQNYDELNSFYSSIVRQLVRSYGDERVELIDIETEFEMEFRKNEKSSADFVLPLPDGLHLNIEGHLLYAKIIGDKLRKLLVNL